MKKQDRDPAIINLWLQRPPGERTRNHVLSFYGWLQQNRPGLVPFRRRGGDPYQALQSILTRHICERPPES